LNTVYQYTPRKTLFGITIPTILAALVFMIMMSDLITGQQTVVTIPLAVLAGIIFLDHFLALSHPEKISCGEGWIEFSSFGRTHHYDVSDIQRINIRKTAFSKSIYVRINDAGLIKGRYWLQIEQLPQGEQLLAFLETLVEQKHPMMKNFKQRSFVKTK